MKIILAILKYVFIVVVSLVCFMAGAVCGVAGISFYTAPEGTTQTLWSTFIPERFAPMLVISGFVCAIIPLLMFVTITKRNQLIKYIIKTNPYTRLDSPYRENREKWIELIKNL